MQSLRESQAVVILRRNVYFVCLDKELATKQVQGLMDLGFSFFLFITLGLEMSDTKVYEP